MFGARSHEIRGFAETAGLVTTGRIADGLCRYFDESDQQLGVDAGYMVIVALHVSAIAAPPAPRTTMSAR